MFVWLAIPVLFIAAGIFFRRDPRHLRIGILLLAALSLTVLALIAAILDKLSSPTNEAAAWFLLGVLAVVLLAIIALALFLVYTGIVMLRREARRLPNLLALILGVSLLGYVAIGFLAIAFNSETLFLWVLFSVPPLGYLGFVFASFVLYAWVYGAWIRRFGGPVTSIIVLGAGLAGDRVTPLLASRLALGKIIYERSQTTENPPAIIVSGGQGSDERISEADAMSIWLVDAGVPKPAILREDRSTTTEENLRYSREVQEEHDLTGSTAVVTNNFHAFRAATLMARLGMPGYAVGSATARYYWPTATIREFVAILRDHLRLNAVILGLLSIPILAFLFALLVR
ncbi:MAG TPA: YdcF family protein [Thermomicrobiales bacterium]|nr:YdcF family protein [Thermomicrobiales bacterium]